MAKDNQDEAWITRKIERDIEKAASETPRGGFNSLEEMFQKLRDG